MNWFINIFIFIILLIIVILIIFLTYFIFGFFPFIKAKELSAKDLKILKNCGLLHKTSAKGYIGINKDCLIKGTKGRKSYSMHFIKAVYFFSIGHMNEEGETFNRNYKYKYMMKIENLTERQLNNMMIREHDNTIMYKGNFKFEKENIITWSEIEIKVGLKERLVSYIQVFTTINSKYSRYLILSTLISCAIFFSLLVIITIY